MPICQYYINGYYIVNDCAKLPNIPEDVISRKKTHKFLNIIKLSII